MVSVLSLQPTSPLHHPPSLRPRVLTLAPIVLSDMLGEKGPEKEEVVWMEWWIQKRGWLNAGQDIAGLPSAVRWAAYLLLLAWAK